MSGIITAAAYGIGWCFCTAAASLLGACCGNDKASTVPPSATSGRKRSIVLLVLTIGIALGFQYGVAPRIVSMSYDPTGIIQKAWLSGCEEHAIADAAAAGAGDGGAGDDAGSSTNDATSISLVERCAGNGGVYRAAGAATVFFALAAAAAACKPTANREAWPAKYVLFLFLIVATVFIPNSPTFDGVYLNIARMGAVAYIGLQQLIIVDCAYEWNDSWVNKSDEAETAEGPGEGQKWLIAILVSCAVMFTASFVGIVLMFVYFGGCPTNDAFVGVTLVLCVLITVAQLSGEEGSLLASACVSTWAVFLCYTAVSKNPDDTCDNPFRGEVNALSIFLGLAVTVISLGWTGWSYTAEDKLVSRQQQQREQDATTMAAGKEEPLVDESKTEGRKVTGVVVTGYGTNNDDRDEERKGAADDGQDDNNTAAMNDPRRLSNSYKLNIILGVVACWTAMALTNWGEISAGGNAANPSAGRVAMWMVIASQWLALSLYAWTLVAPRLFPDRDFS